jgi:6-phosphogluconolactonase (cycloisomerase 2 family)
MKLSLVGRFALALFATTILGLGMTGCGGGTIAFMWVLGQQYNQIAGFKVDDYTGNLTQIPHEPFTSGGSAPVSIVIKPGGRYVYVLNQGTGGTQGVHATSGNVAVFSVGGDGTLTFQQSYITQGYNSQWMQFDTTGTYLYVLDQYSPSGDGNGAITAFASDSASGRLTLIQDTQSVANGQAALTYFEVGSASQPEPNPFMMKTAGNCLFVTNGSAAIVPFAFAGGQLVTPTNGPTTISGNIGHISSLGGNSAYLTITDSGLNTIQLESIGSSCGLTSAGGGPYSLAQYGTTDPDWSLIDNSGKYLYVLNRDDYGNPTVRYSSIVAFTISQTNSQLQLISGSPYGVGSAPVCAVEDPTNQYLYTSNHNDGTISGNVLDNTTGILSPLTRGATFSATGDSECLAISGAVD